MAQNMIDELFSGQYDELHFNLGSPVKGRRLGEWKNITDRPLMPSDWGSLTKKLLSTNEQIELENLGYTKNLFDAKGISFVEGRFFQSQNSMSAHLKRMPYQVENTSLPEVLFEVIQRRRGLSLLSGVAGSGTTLLIHQILAELDKKESIPVSVFSPRAFPVFPEKNLSISYVQASTLKDLHKEIALSSEIIIFDYNDLSHLSFAVELADAGKGVVFTAHSSHLQSLLMNLYSFSSTQGEFYAYRLMAQMQYLFHHQFLRTTSGGISIFESLLFSQELRELFLKSDVELIQKAEKLNNLYASRNQCLLQNLIRRKIDMKKAFELTHDPSNLDQLLKKVGI